MYLLNSIFRLSLLFSSNNENADEIRITMVPKRYDNIKFENLTMIKQDKPKNN